MKKQFIVLSSIALLASLGNVKNQAREIQGGFQETALSESLSNHGIRVKRAKEDRRATVDLSGAETDGTVVSPVFSQDKKNDDGTENIRFVCGIHVGDYDAEAKSLAVDELGFNVSYTYNGTEYDYSYPVNTVYTDIKAGDIVYTRDNISTLGVTGTYDYFMTYALLNIPEDAFKTDITVRPFVKIGETYHTSGAAKTETVDNLDPVQILNIKVTDINGNEVDEDVMENSTLSLKATVSGNRKGVTWSSDNTDVAEVENGVVTFKEVDEDTIVNIIAKSTACDYSTSIPFWVHDTVIDLEHSRGKDLDVSNIAKGSISSSEGDTALVFDKVHGTKWYVEADIVINSTEPTDPYPKFGIMSGTSQGRWNDQGSKNNFFYLDTIRDQTSWTNFNMVGQNAALNDWDWGGQYGSASIPDDQAVSRGDKITMGLLRDGVNYYYFFSNHKDRTDYAGEEDPICIKHVVDSHIGAEEATYAWIGGWNDATTVSKFEYLTGDDVDSKYTDPIMISLANGSANILSGDTYQIEASLNVHNATPGSFTYSSEDEDVATVDEHGLITGGDTAGITYITVSYGNLSTRFEIHVTKPVSGEWDEVNKEYPDTHIKLKDGESFVLDNYELGGWNNYINDMITDLPNDDWTVKMTFNNQTNWGDGGAWKSALPILRDSEGGDRVVFRFDWWGWSDNVDGDDKCSMTGTNGNVDDSATMDRDVGWCNFEQELPLIWRNFDAVGTYVMHEGKISVSYKITSPNVLNNDGSRKEFTYNVWTSGVTANKISLGFSAEFAKLTVSSVIKVA